MAWGEFGTQSGQFNEPGGVAIGRNKTVFVAPATKLTGSLELRGRAPSDEELARLRREPTAEELAPMPGKASEETPPVGG